MNGGSEYGDDVLLIVGDVSCYSSQVDFFFQTTQDEKRWNNCFCAWKS